MLLYPLDGNEVEWSSAEERGPWRTESGSYVRFERIPVTEETAVTKLAALLRDNEEGRSDTYASSRVHPPGKRGFRPERRCNAGF